MGAIYQEGNYYGVDTARVFVMPAADAIVAGKMVQYVGETTQTYHEGYFYKCSEESAGVFAWVNVSVQDGTISRELTQAQYDALPDATKRDGTVYYVTDVTPFVLDNADYGFTPIGTIISVMGNSAPRNYLVCNGQTVNIIDYPELANYFETQFGSKNYFGGDGTTTFAVPDLRGEFLRGTGTNSHTNQGSGGDVGEHQDATELPYYNTSQGGSIVVRAVSNDSLSSKNVHSSISGSDSYITAKNSVGSNSYPKALTSRPTNTSVLYCIAYRNIYITHEHIDERNKYSTTEKVVGEWIDGKLLYQKTIEFTAPTVSTSSVTKDLVTLDSTWQIKNIFGTINWWSSSSSYGLCSIPTYFASNNYCSFTVYSDSSLTNILQLTVTGSAYSQQTGTITIQYTKTV